jgi:RNA polymerase sigma-70 factor (ECF subfamily)
VEADVVTADLIARARTGDGEAFRALTEPHRRELLVHCYRMLGSVPDAEDALQDTLLAAWQGLAGFGERASVRTWLYRIATNKCLNAIRTTRRRPVKAWDIPEVEPPEPSGHGTVAWLGAFPDALLDGAFDTPAGPEARYEQSESIGLAFISAPAGAATASARGPGPARRPGVSGERDRRPAGRDRARGQQCPQPGAHRPATK